MAITFEEINLIQIFKDLGKICKTPEVCGGCAERDCLIGYSRNVTADCRIGKTTCVPNGYKNIPPSDIRGGYDEYDVLHAIAHLLYQCRGCMEDHYDDCLINVVRSALEVIEFGEEQSYEGDPISYMFKIAGIDADKANIIRREYLEHKKQLT